MEPQLVTSMLVSRTDCKARIGRRVMEYFVANHQTKLIRSKCG